MKLILLCLAGFIVLQPNSAEEYHSYMPWPKCHSKEKIRSPETLQQLRRLVQEAGFRSEKLKVVGAGHTSNELICTDGTPIDMKHFSSMTLNEDNTLTVGSGARLRDLLLFLHEKGRTLVNFPSLGILTIGGLTGTGAHGSSLIKPSSLSDQILSMRILDGTGEIRTVEDEKELDIFRIHLGLLGIVIDVRLGTVPRFKLDYSRKVEPDSFLLSGEALQLAEKIEYLQLHWFPVQSNVVVVKGVYQNASVPGNAYTTVYGDTKAKDIGSFQAALDALQEKRDFRALHAIENFTMLSFTEKVVGRGPIVTEDGVTLKNPAVGWNFNITSGPCTSCTFTHGPNSLLNDDASLGCDVRKFNGILRFIQDVSNRLPLHSPLSGIIMRFHRQSNSLLSMAYGKPKGIVLVELITPSRSDYLNKPRAGLAAVQAISQALVFKYGCRPHWGKNGRALRSRSILHSVFDPKGIKALTETMEKYDPLGVFQNDFATTLLGQSNEDNPRSEETQGCALQDNCFCKEDRDCAGLEQKCEKFVDFEGKHTYSVCKDKKTYEDKQIAPEFYDPYNLTDVLGAFI